jgi:starch synthase
MPQPQVPRSPSQAAKQQINVLFATPQCAPFARAGGLAPIPLELGEVLKQLPPPPKVDVRIILPYYQKGVYSNFSIVFNDVPTDVTDANGNQIKVSIWKAEVQTRQAGPITVYAVRNDGVFSGNMLEYIPGPPLAGVTPALRAAAKPEAIKFAVFSSAVVKLLKHPNWPNVSGNWFPNVIHCHDWQTGLIPAYLDTFYNTMTHWHPHSKPKTLFTFHFAPRTDAQGVFHLGNSDWDPDTLLKQCGWFSGAADPVYNDGNPPWKNIHHNCSQQAWAGQNPDWSELNCGVSFLKGGLAFSDASNTVSKTYAEEMNDIPLSLGNEETIQGLMRQGKWSGIINGFDYKQYDPNTDRFIGSPYNLKNFNFVKGQNKEVLMNWMNQRLAALAMSPQSSKPRHVESNDLGSPNFDWKNFIVGFHKFDLGKDYFLAVLPARIAYQKGIDIALERIDDMFQRMPKLRIIVMGTGDYKDPRDRYIRDKIIYAAQNHPKEFLFIQWFDDAWERMLMAAADLFLMPSRFEPCGIAQQRAHHYGAPVLGSEVGGIKDTVKHLKDCVNNEPVPKKADGFLFRLKYPALSGTPEYQNAYQEFVNELQRAYDCWGRNKACWNRLIENSMKRPHSWTGSAREYREAYASIDP